MMVHRYCLGLVLFGLVTSSTAQKPNEQHPRIQYAVPLVVRAGEKQTLVLRGSRLDSVTGITVEGPNTVHARFLAARKAVVPANVAAERVGDTEVELEILVPRDIKPGQIAIRTTGPTGQSKPYQLLLRDQVPPVVEQEPNDGFDTAQLITLPSAVEATIKGERDPDVFKFRGKKGESIHIQVQASQFGSPVDALLTVSDSRRRIIGLVDDTNGQPDPVVSMTLPGDDMYYVTVVDAHDLGGPMFGYRLVVQVQD
jgi:hypothetical protein